MNKLADSLRADAPQPAKISQSCRKKRSKLRARKVDNPTVNLPKVRRTGLPPAHAAVFDLKVGEVSAVISDNGGHYIYKVVSKEVLPLDLRSKAEIHNKLKSERMKEMMDKVHELVPDVHERSVFRTGEVTEGARWARRPSRATAADICRRNLR